MIETWQSSRIQGLKKGSRIHLMGVCGTAMGSLAGLLQSMGYVVSGSDSNPYPPMSTQLEKLGIPIRTPYSKENLQPRPDFVIVGNVISRTNPEAEELARIGVPYTSLPKALGELFLEQRDSLVVAGTHGKTTTTALLSWVAEKQNLSPGFLIGGVPKNFENSFRVPQKNCFVIEGDEYDTAFFDKVPKFVHYFPKSVILTSIEFDHADIYDDLNAVKEAFRRLVNLLDPGHHLMAYGEDSNIREVLQGSRCRTWFYGTKDSDYLVKDIRSNPDYTQFRVEFQGKSLGDFRIQLPGKHNVLNATAVIALSERKGWDLEVTRLALQEFRGVKRRQEILGEPGGVLVIEDFAHHPTAVKETLAGIRARYRDRKIWAVFEPRSATSRRKVFQKEYAVAFKDADKIILAPAVDARIQNENLFSSDELAQDLNGSGQSAEALSSVEQIIQRLVSQCKAGDLIIIMSNGGFDGIYSKLLEALAK